MKSVSDLLASWSAWPDRLKKQSTSLKRSAGLVRSALAGDSLLTLAEQDTLRKAAVLLEKMAAIHMQASRESLMRQRDIAAREVQALALMNPWTDGLVSASEKLSFIAAVNPHQVRDVESAQELQAKFSEARKDCAWRLARDKGSLEEAVQKARDWYETRRSALVAANLERANRIAPSKRG